MFSPLMDGFKGLCCPKANNSGMRGSPCSPPSPCEMYWVMPISSSHKFVDGLPQKHLTKGRIWSPPSIRRRPSNIAFRENKIVRPDPVDRHNCHFWIQICQGLQYVSNALTSCFGGQGVLEGRLASRSSLPLISAKHNSSGLLKTVMRPSRKDCTNSEYESPRNSRPYWNCTIWRFIRRQPDLIITDWRRWWKEESIRIYESKNLKPETEIMKETPWSRIRGQNSVNIELQETVGSGKPTANDLKKTIAISEQTWMSVHNRHSPNPSPTSLARQNERNASRTRNPRGRNPSGRLSWWPCKDYLQRN